MDERENEINTYDFPPLLPGEDRESTKCFTRVKRKRHGVLFGIYAFAAVSILLLTLIFSAVEICDFVMDDLGAKDFFIKRIFGTASSGDGLYEMILGQTFFTAAPETDATLPQMPSKSPETLSPTTESNAPTITDAPTEAPTQPESTPPETIPADMLPIIKLDMSLLSYGESYIYNDTSLSPNIPQLLKKKLTSYYTGDFEPLVLVVHTHATESFMPEGATHYKDEGEIARSDNVNENMVAVGAEFARILNESGIPTLHCEILHDAESYRESYKRSAETIARYLDEYPSIKYVFDLHRDSLVRSTGELISAVASVGGKDCAQIMPVVGSGFRGYEDNLALALQLRAKLNGQYQNLSRPVCLRESKYNQDLAPVSLLLEIGTSGNTLSEAKYAAAIVAEALTEIIKGK